MMHSSTFASNLTNTNASTKMNLRQHPARLQFNALAILAASLAPIVCIAERIPFPDALDSAAVVESELTDINREALVLGNGDLNALLWEREGALRMRVTKNDIWDARIDTSRDPDLLRMDIKNRTWKGGTGNVPSWHGTPYPVPRCAAEVVIGEAPTTESVAGAWACIRRGKHNAWESRGGAAVMSVDGQPGVSAGYGTRINRVTTTGVGALGLRLSGTANAQYFVDVLDAGGKSLVHSGWLDVPPADDEVSFPVPQGRTVAKLDVFVMSKDGEPAEVRFRAIQFNLGQSVQKDVDLTKLGVSSWHARLDLRRAVATLEGDRQARTVVRTLADRNVFLIESPNKVSLREVPASYLPPAQQGETDGVQWLHMRMPGDVDYKGMDYALAVASRGNTKAVSVVTSFDTTGDVREAAIQAARETLAASSAELIRAHEAAWTEFWSASGLQLGDRFFQDAWYRNMYYMRCFCRPGTTMPITLYAGLANDKPGWHGAPTLDYNIEQVFWPMFSCNQVDLMEPYVRYIAGFAPRARWLAKKTYGLDGLSESWAFAGLTAELLLQSVNDIVRVFPAWPEEKDASFVDLRAQGGFLVSAEQRAGDVVQVRIISTAGGQLQMLSPWAAVSVRRDTHRPRTLQLNERAVVTMDTRPSEVLVFAPER